MIPKLSQDQALNAVQKHAYTFRRKRVAATEMPTASNAKDEGSGTGKDTP